MHKTNAVFFYFHLGPLLKPWQNENLGWIKNPKRDTGKFYNTVLESMHDLHGNYCPNQKDFRKLFLIERTRLWEAKKKLDTIDKELDYFMNPNNEASLGPLLKEDYIPKKTDRNRVERLDNMLNGFSERVEKERKTVMDHDQTLYLKSTHVLKRGREYQHKGNNMIIDICHKLSIRISKIKDNLNKFKSKLNDIFKNCWWGERSKPKESVK